MYETTNMLQDTVVIPTTKNGMPTYSPTGSANAEDVIADDRYRQGSAKFGYVVWLADNSVFDIAGNSFAGSGKYFFFQNDFFVCIKFIIVLLKNIVLYI